MRPEWPGFDSTRHLRQWPVLEYVVTTAAQMPEVRAVLMVGSFARGQADPMSDLDFVIVAQEGAFEAAWRRRYELHGEHPLAMWDEVRADMPRCGGHSWMTSELVLVESLIAEASSRVRLARPFVVVAGDDSVGDHFEATQPSDPSAETSADLHPVDRAYGQLRDALRIEMDRPGGPWRRPEG